MNSLILDGFVSSIHNDQDFFVLEAAKDTFLELYVPPTAEATALPFLSNEMKVGMKVRILGNVSVAEFGDLILNANFIEAKS